MPSHRQTTLLVLLITICACESQELKEVVHRVPVELPSERVEPVTELTLEADVPYALVVGIDDPPIMRGLFVEAPVRAKLTRLGAPSPHTITLDGTTMSHEGEIREQAPGTSDDDFIQRYTYILWVLAPFEVEHDGRYRLTIEPVDFDPAPHKGTYVGIAEISERGFLELVFDELWYVLLAIVVVLLVAVVSSWIERPAF